MDNIDISGTEPPSVILSQTKESKKLISVAKKYQTKVKPKGMV